VNWVWFERLILALILINSVLLATRDLSFRVNNPIPYWRTSLQFIADAIFTLLFTVELLLKVIAQGLVLEKGTYLRDVWNVMDFVVVVTGLFGLLPFIPDFSVVSIIRTLRPLRSINHVRGIKVLVGSLVRSLPNLLNVVIFLLLMMLVFGTIGV
jgi:Ion transport protein